DQNVLQDIEKLLKEKSPSKDRLADQPDSKPVADPLASEENASPGTAPRRDPLKRDSAGVHLRDYPKRRVADRDETSSIRVPIERVDRLLNLVGEMVITQSILSQTAATLTPEKLEHLREAVAQMDRHARELHERMMAIRMVPLRQLFGRVPRLVRDLAAAVGKEVELSISGEDTELDRTVIEKI